MQLFERVGRFIGGLQRTGVLENYAWISLVNFISPLIGIVLYPFVIRRIGADSYGYFVFAQAIACYAVQIISFGLDIPPAKRIVECQGDRTRQSRVLMEVLTIKVCVFLLVSIPFIVTIYVSPLLSQHKKLFFFSFGMLFAELFNVQWFYQAIKKLRITSVTTIIFRLLMIPAVFLFIKGPEDNVTYMCITSISLMSTSLWSLFWLFVGEGLRPVRVTVEGLKEEVRECLPFFGAYFFGQLKTSTLSVLVGVFIGMTEVSIFDLGNKLVTIVKNFTQSINTVLFPEIMENTNSSRIYRVLRYERYVSFAVICGILFFGYPVVWILGGHEMLLAYPVAVVLSFTVYASLLSAAFQQFIFVPENHYSYVTMTQIVSLITCLFGYLILASVFDRILPNYEVLAVAFAMTFAGICEMSYCRYACRKIHKQSAKNV